MIYLVLGVIVGLLLAVIAMLSVRRYQTPIERLTKRAENLTKEKGEVFVEDEAVEDLKAWAESLPAE
jgi:ABC-type lipoprotein release transport system permease subunit